MRPSEDTLRRRRLALAIVVAALAAVVLTAVLSTGGGGESGLNPAEQARLEGKEIVTIRGQTVTDDGNATGEPPPPREPVDRLRIDQQVGQALVLSFAGTELPDYVGRALETGRVAGVILFGDNVADPEQVQQLTDAAQEAARGSALISLDQEGGEVRILPWAPPDVTPPDVAGPAAAEASAEETATALHDAGVNVNLAPVADLVRGPGSVMAARAYPADAVIEDVAAAVAGFRAGGVAPTAKHFPGLGAATANTDDEPVTVKASAAEIRARDLPAFRAAIKAGAPLVMSSHALYPGLDPARIASQSPRILRTVLREQLGFTGVVITDSMEAAAVTARSDVPTAALAALRAGNDLILTTGQGSYRPTYLAMLAEARRSPVFSARVREAARRVLALKRVLGLKPPR